MDGGATSGASEIDMYPLEMLGRPVLCDLRLRHQLVVAGAAISEHEAWARQNDGNQSGPPRGLVAREKGIREH